MATIDLGKIKFNWRGTYAGGTAYVPDDVVYYMDGSVGSSYMCVANTTGNAPSSGGTLHASWEYLAKGQAVSPTTNQGDIIVRGASADGRLAIGAAGKVLKVNSSANGLEYGDAGGWTQIASGTGPSSAVTSINIDNIFSDTYKYYKVYIKWTQDDWLKVRLITAGGVTDTGQAYTWCGYSVSENADSNQRFGSNATTYGIATYYNGSDNSNCITELTFSNPYDSATEGIWTWNAGYREGSKMWHENGACINTNNASYRGIHLFGHNGDSIADSNFNYVVLGTGIGI